MQDETKPNGARTTYPGGTIIVRATVDGLRAKAPNPAPILASHSKSSERLGRFTIKGELVDVEWAPGALDFLKKLGRPSRGANLKKQQARRRKKRRGK